MKLKNVTETMLKLIVGIHPQANAISPQGKVLTISARNQRRIQARPNIKR